jgi:hypothetical protein
VERCPPTSDDHSAEKETAPMDPFGYHTKLVELAYSLATEGAADNADVLRRFRTIYRHMAASVDSVMVELGQGPFGPMGAGMPGVQVPPDIGRLLADTDKGLESL